MWCSREPAAAHSHPSTDNPHQYISTHLKPGLSVSPQGWLLLFTLTSATTVLSVCETADAGGSPSATLCPSLQHGSTLDSRKISHTSLLGHPSPHVTPSPRGFSPRVQTALLKESCVSYPSTFKSPNVHYFKCVDFQPLVLPELRGAYWIRSKFPSPCVCVCVCVQSFSCGWLLCNLTDSSLSGSSVHGILQARILESESESRSVVSDSV